MESNDACADSVPLDDPRERIGVDIPVPPLRLLAADLGGLRNSSTVHARDLRMPSVPQPRHHIRGYRWTEHHSPTTQGWLQNTLATRASSRVLASSGASHRTSTCSQV